MGKNEPSKRCTAIVKLPSVHLPSQISHAWVFFFLTSTPPQTLSLLCCCIASVVSDSVRPHRRQPNRLPVPGTLQARTLEWVAIAFSNAWKWKVKVKLLSCVRLLATPWTAAYQAPPSMGFPGKSTGVGCHCLLHYLYYKFSSTDLATKAGQRKILCIGMRARKAAPQIKTLPFNSPLPSSVGMTMMLQVVLFGALSVGIRHDNE